MHMVAWFNWWQPVYAHGSLSDDSLFMHIVPCLMTICWCTWFPVWWQSVYEHGSLSNDNLFMHMVPCLMTTCLCTWFLVWWQSVYAHGSLSNDNLLMHIVPRLYIIHQLCLANTRDRHHSLMITAYVVYTWLVNSGDLTIPVIEQ